MGNALENLISINICAFPLKTHTIFFGTKVFFDAIPFLVVVVNEFVKLHSEHSYFFTVLEKL